MLASDGGLACRPAREREAALAPHSQRCLADQASGAFLCVPKHAVRISGKLKHGVWYQWLQGSGARQESLLSVRTSHHELSHRKMLWLHAQH
jgi:hypothetical protein